MDFSTGNYQEFLRMMMQQNNMFNNNMNNIFNNNFSNNVNNIDMNQLMCLYNQIMSNPVMMNNFNNYMNMMSIQNNMNINQMMMNMAPSVLMNIMMQSIINNQNNNIQNQQIYQNNNIQQQFSQSPEYINLIFITSEYKITIPCKPNEGFSSVVTKFLNKSNNNDVNYYLFNSNRLNESLTVGEQGLIDASEIYVINTSNVKGAK